MKEYYSPLPAEVTIGNDKVTIEVNPSKLAYHLDHQSHYNFLDKTEADDE